MESYPIYIVFGIVAVVYIVFLLNTRRVSKNRKSKKFMDGYTRDKDSKNTNGKQ